MGKRALPCQSTWPAIFQELSRPMPSDQNPWNLGGNGARRPPNPPIKGPWGGGGGGPGGSGPQIPPELENLLTQLRALFNRFFGGGSLGLAIIAAIAVACIWLASGFYRVEPDEEGLVLRFGAYVGNTGPGLNWHLPYPVETAQILPVTRINRVEIGFRSSAVDEPDVTARSPEGRVEPARGMPARDLAEESLMLTGDENIVDINASVFWKISDAAAYAFNTRNPGYTVKSAAESVLRQVVGHTPIQSALTEGRAAIEQAVTTGTQAILDQYHSGVQITQVQLQKVDPPADVIESFRDVQRANTDADTARNDAQSYANDIVPRARGESAAILAEATGAKQAAVSAANGQSQRFLSVYAAYSLAKDVTLKRLYIETMQDVLSHAPTIVIDDKLKSLLPTLQLNGPAPAPARSQGDDK
jgi:membrane protease subunit HflK